MLQHPMRGPGRGSFISGKSVHNQRIERLWRDVFQSCLVIFYRLFYAMEGDNLLNVDDDNLLNVDYEIYDTHLFCLIYVFIPRINAAIKEFMESWNHHPLSSEHNMSPVQLWIAGLSTCDNLEVCLL